jgi:chemotaxis protein MotB
VIKGGGTDLTRTTGQVRSGDIEAERKTINLQALKEQAAREEAASLEGLKQRIEQSVTNNPLLVQFRSQIRIDITQDGLRIQIVDEQNRPMFDSGSAVVKDYMRTILREIGKVLSEVNNKVTLAGHTDAAPYSSGERGYSNWELSADRANASRRELVAGGLREGQVVRVLGLASSSLLDKDNPLNPINRRISIIVMNKDAEERFERGGDIEAGTAPAVSQALPASSTASHGENFSFPAPGR